MYKNIQKNTGVDQKTQEGSAKSVESAIADNKHQAGATLILVVLVSAFIMLSFLTIASQLSISSLQVTSDQKSILPAQFAAESGLSYSRALLKAGGDLVSLSAHDPKNISYGQLKYSLSKLCGNAPHNINVRPSSGNDWNTPITIEGIVVSGVKVCNLADFNTNQVSLFTSILPYEGTKKTQYSSHGIKEDQRAKFFSELFSGSKTRSFEKTSYKAGLTPLMLVRSNNYTYDLYFKVADIVSEGVMNDAKRKMVMVDSGGLRKLQLKFNVKSAKTQTDPSFANFGLFINVGDAQTNTASTSHFDPRAGFYNHTSSFSGRVHTNQYWSLQADRRHNSVKIDGYMSSSACKTLKTSYDANGDRTDECLSQSSAGIYDFSGKKYKEADMDYSGTNVSTFLPTDISYTEFDRYGGSNQIGNSKRFLNITKGSKKPNFRTDLIKLPKNNSNQAGMGKDKGIFLSKGAYKVEMLAEGDYQKINIIVPMQCSYYYGCTQKTVYFRFSKDKVMQIKKDGRWVNAKKDNTTSTGWTAVNTGETTKTEFNGMIYSDHDIKSLHGPARPSGDNTASRVKPAIAKHAAITVTARNNITLTGDLLYEERCIDVRSSTCTEKEDDKYKTKNILGIYSYSGDILLGNEKSSTRQDTSYSRPNAPKNLELDAFIMSGRGKFRPTSFRYSTDKGSVYVRGGMIKNSDAVVKRGKQGWYENYLYDKRGEDYSPPGFPTYTEGIVTTSPITDTTLVSNVSITPMFPNDDGNSAENQKLAGVFDLIGEVRAR